MNLYFDKIFNLRDASGRRFVKAIHFRLRKFFQSRTKKQSNILSFLKTILKMLVTVEKMY